MDERMDRDMNEELLGWQSDQADKGLSFEKFHQTLLQLIFIST